MAQSEVFHIKAIADFSQPEKEAARIRTKLDREINSAFRNMEKSFGQPLGHITGRMDEFASSLEASNARVIAFGASAGIVYQVSKAFRELVRSTIDVEKSMADIQVVLNANTKQLERYRSGIFNIAKQTGQSFSEVSKAATELARQGLDAEKTLVRLKDALVLSRLSGMDTLDSVEALTAAINGFGETVVNSTALVNKFATVDQKFAVSSQDLAEAFKRVGSTAVDAGVSIDELIALVTSAQQITARGGSVIGNSFKTIFTRIQRPQVLQDLEEAGIKVKNFSGESLKAVDILTNLAKSYDTLSSSQKSFVSEAVGGVFQINVLKALLKDIDGDFSIFSNALNASANASDAAAKKNELLNKTLDSLINKSVENLREFAVVLGEVTVKPIIVKTLSAINTVVETIVKNKEGLGTVLDIIGKFVSGPVFGLIAGSLIRLFAGFSKYALQAGAQIAGLTKRQEDVARIQNLINNLLISQPELYKQIQTSAISVEQAEKRVLNILRQQSAERAKMMQFSSGAASAVFASGVRVDTRKKTLTGTGIPNLANPLREAIQREIGSGIPKSAIRIGSDSRLASSSNPSGIGVYNTIDEPMGIGQGISRSQRMGINPKTAGIPNFAFQKKKIIDPATGKPRTILFDPTTGQSSTSEKEISKASIYSAMRDQARMFADEFKKILTDPKVSKVDRENLVLGVSKALKEGHPLSVKNISTQTPEAKQFVENFKGRAYTLTKDQREDLRDAIYKEGFGVKSSSLLQAGSVGYRTPTPTFKTEQDVATGQFYAVREDTGKRTKITQTRARRIQKQNEILNKTLEPYILSDEEIRDRSSRMSKMEAPLGVGQSIFADSKRKSTILSDRAELIKQIRNINPNVSISVASKLADYQIKTGIDVVGQTKQHLASQPSPSKAAGVGLVDLSGNKRFRTSLSPSYYGSQWSSFPTFSRMFSGSGKTGANGGMYQRLRNMDPMNKMMLLSGVGMLGSIGSSYIERSAMEDQSLTGMQKKNRSLLAGTIGSTLTGAMLGGSLTAGTGIGMLGGAAIGGIVAAAFSIGDVLKNWNDILPDLQINLEKTSRKIQEMNETSQGVSSVLFKLANPPEFKSEAERNKYVRETESEFKKEMSRRGISGPSRAAVYSEIGSGKSLEEIIANIQKIFASETKKLEPTLALQELTTGIIKSQRENVDMEFGPLLSQIRSQRFGTLGEARGKMSKEAADSINDTIQQILGKINTITTPQRGIVGSNMGVPIYGEITDPSKLRILKSPEIVKMTEGLLQNAGLDKTSEEYQKLILSLSKSLEDGTSSLESFIFALKNIIPRSVEKANTSLEKLFENALKASQKRITEDLYGRGLRGSESIRESRLELVRRSVERQRSLSNIQFNQEKDIFGLQTTPITPTQRSLREISIKRSAERSALPFKTNELRDQMIGNLLSARGEALSMLSQEDASLQQIEVGKELDDLYGKLLENVRSGNLKEVEDEIYHTLGIFQDQLTKTDSAIHKNAINSLSELNQSFASYEGQILSLSEALRQSEELESKREELLRKQLDPRFATGDFYRSESATRNAIRRAQQGSDPSTEITSSFRAFREEMGYTVNDFYTDFENSARDAAQTFKSEFKSAFNDFRRGSIDAGEALRQFAINVLDRIATNASNMAIDSLLNAAFGGASNIFANVRKSRTGGMVRKRYADGGMVTGGSGVVDDVPALLTSGEMVINREAVRTYGADYFNKINQGRGARAKLENRFLYLDDKGNISSSPTQGEARVSAALSNIGATNELMRANTDRFSREQRFVAYVQQRRAYNEQRSQAMKRYEKGIRQQAIAAGVSAGIGIGGSAIGGYMDSRAAASATPVYGPQQMPPAQTFANDALSNYKFKSTGFFSRFSNNSGSIVPNFGSSNRDNIPYSLTGGEAVLRKEAVSMYGQQFVKDLNNGQVKTMRFGSQQNSPDVYSDLRNLPSSIDRLSSAITNLENRSSSSQDMNPNGGINNEFTFNIEIKSDSGNVSVQSGNMEQNKTGSGASEQDMKKIGEAVKGVVEQSISANLRPGGQIYNAIRRR